MTDTQVRFKPEEISNQIKGLLSEKYVSPDYLKLYEAIYAVQYKTEKELRLRDLCPAVSKEAASRRLDEGLPALDESKIKFSEPELLKLLEKIIAILEENTKGQNPSARHLVESAKAGKITLKEIVLTIMRQDGDALKAVAEKVQTHPVEIVFLGKMLLQPFLRVCARPVRRVVNLEEVMTEHCPVCGGAPLMARLRPDDGKRVFECSLCGTEWVYNRLRCPYCGNEDAESLGYFYAEGNEDYRADKCDACHHYVKSVDERKNAGMEKRALAVLDVASLYLDILAEKEGYHSLRE